MRWPNRVLVALGLLLLLQATSRAGERAASPQEYALGLVRALRNGNVSGVAKVLDSAGVAYLAKDTRSALKVAEAVAIRAYEMAAISPSDARKITMTIGELPEVLDEDTTIGRRAEVWALAAYARTNAAIGGRTLRDDWLEPVAEIRTLEGQGEAKPIDLALAAALLVDAARLHPGHEDDFVQAETFARQVRKAAKEDSSVASLLIDADLEAAILHLNESKSKARKFSSRALSSLRQLADTRAREPRWTWRLNDAVTRVLEAGLESPVDYRAKKNRTRTKSPWLKTYDSVSLAVLVPISPRWEFVADPEGRGLGTQSDVGELTQRTMDGKVQRVFLFEAYDWDHNYGSVGGDNAKGLAQDTYTKVSRAFTVIEDRTAPKPGKYGRKLPKGYVWSVSGIGAGGTPMRVQAGFFKTKGITYAVLETIFGTRAGPDPEGAFIRNAMFYPRTRKVH